MSAGHGIVDSADAGAFLARLVRLEHAALVRLRPAAAGARTALWARLPWEVLAVRTVAGACPGDVTVAAGQLLAAGTLRAAAEHGVGGRAVGQRVLRDALLDHVAVVVTPDDEPDRPVEVTQRMVQGLVRMGFLAASEDSSDADGVQVRAAGRWVGLVGPYGAIWSQKATDLVVRPSVTHPNG
ncbi:hypothetical protein [Verrucosispora sioxanthis]|uniref:hypothetical protein n=1 Tax=Verrucosispora sioxanthis TaxID=2499994 RepID=UPI001C110398|nr:hypothetical protein [Verrucosispora sioxanthis]